MIWILSVVVINAPLTPYIYLMRPFKLQTFNKLPWAFIKSFTVLGFLLMNFLLSVTCKCKSADSNAAGEIASDDAACVKKKSNCPLYAFL